MSKLSLSLVTPTAEVFSGLVDEVVAPGSEGEFGVLAQHAPFMTILSEGQVTITNEGDRTVYDIKSGFADVSPQGVVILAEQLPIVR
jgi:F-type H+-transporting ATPase subunit epsilon